MAWDISVGQVSGLIATGIFLLQLLIPLSLPVLLVAFVSDTNTTVTWSSLGRFLHTSLWPSILRTDTAASKGVKKSVSLMGHFQLLALGLISLTSIITPLGLYDVVTSNDISSKAAEFRYINDSSPFGTGTPARSNAPFTRACGNEAVCPGGNKTEHCVQKGLAQVCNNTVFDRSIPSVYTRLFGNGATSFSPSLSSIFDVEWRSYVNSTDSLGSLGWGLKPAYRQISTLILEPKSHIVEGLIVNLKTGGIGFRNHTIPNATYPYGSTWTEDLLFIEPETQCVDLNFTFNFHLENTANSARPYIRGIYIKDAGGLSNLSRKAPVNSLSTPSSYNGQGELNLRSRAFNAAWLNNYLTLLYYNLTNPDMNNITRIDAKHGMQIQTNLDSLNSTFAIQYQSIRSNTTYGNYLNFTENISSDSNPFNVTGNHFSKIVAQCNGALFSDPANLNSSLVGCGMLYGAARRTDGGDSLIPDPGSQWAMPVFSCASSISAVVKTITFKLNGTALTALQVVDEKPKVYATPSDMPLWAVEDMEWPKYSIGNAQPLWGIIGTANATVDKSIRSNVTTISQEKLRLPGLIDDFGFLLSGAAITPNDASQNLPGVNFYTQALKNAFSISMPIRMSYGDYSGQTQFALYAKWQKLSASADSAAEIINLVWTDIAANTVVGTKGWGLGSGSKTKSVPVTAYHKQVRFKMPYSVPAFVTIGVCIALLVAIVTLAATKKTGLAKLRFLIDATSAGRNVGILLWPAESSASTIKTKDWVETIGPRRVTAVPGNFVAVDAVSEQQDDEEDEKEEEENQEVQEQTETLNKKA